MTSPFSGGWYTAFFVALVGCYEGEIRLGTDGGASHTRCTSTCPISSLVCVDGMCFECNADSDCKSDALKRCDIAAHRCIQCGFPADCPEDQTCGPTNRCLKKCTSSVQCTNDEARTCGDALRMYCVACVTSLQCPPERPACDTRSEQCVQCVGDSDCKKDPERRRCDPATQQCVKCLSDSDCPRPDAPYCDLTQKECSGPN
jgi:hypothetical protein